MIGVCLGLAGVIWAHLPVGEFALTWQHSVEKLRWEEDYQVRGRQLHLSQARIEGTGAGMDIPPGARLEHGRWHYQPDISVNVLRLARTPEAGDYTLCWQARCQPLAAWLGPPTQATPGVELWPCELG